MGTWPVSAQETAIVNASLSKDLVEERKCTNDSRYFGGRHIEYILAYKRLGFSDSMTVRK